MTHVTLQNIGHTFSKLLVYYNEFRSACLANDPEGTSGTLGGSCDHDVAGSKDLQDTLVLGGLGCCSSGEESKRREDRTGEAEGG